MNNSSQIISQLQPDKNKCFYCDFPIKKPLLNSDKNIFRLRTREHVVTRKAGGSDTVLNIVFACATCNSERGSKKLEIFYEIVDSEYTRAQISKLIGHIELYGKYLTLPNVQPYYPLKVKTSPKDKPKDNAIKTRELERVISPYSKPNVYTGNAVIYSSHDNINFVPVAQLVEHRP